jgi:hypothetical protein
VLPKGPANPLTQLELEDVTCLVLPDEGDLLFPVYKDHLQGPIFSYTMAPKCKPVTASSVPGNSSMLHGSQCAWRSGRNLHAASLLTHRMANGGSELGVCCMHGQWDSCLRLLELWEEKVCVCTHQLWGLSRPEATVIALAFTWPEPAWEWCQRGEQQSQEVTIPGAACSSCAEVSSQVRCFSWIKRQIPFNSFLFLETGVWTQGFVLAKWELYCLSHTSSFGYFGDGV